MVLVQSRVGGFARGMVTDHAASGAALLLKDVIVDRTNQVRKRGARAQIGTQMDGTVGTPSQLVGVGSGTVLPPGAVIVSGFTPCAFLINDNSGIIYGRTSGGGTWRNLGSSIKDPAGADINLFGLWVRCFTHDGELIGTGFDPQGSNMSMPKWNGLEALQADYTTGTVSTTASSTTITGLGTTWLANVNAGAYIVFSNAGLQERTFKIMEVVSNTSLIVDVAPDVTAAGQTYRVQRLGRVSAQDNIFCSAASASAVNVNWPVARCATSHQGRIFLGSTVEPESGRRKFNYGRLRWSALATEAASGKFKGGDRWDTGGFADVYPGIGGEIVGLAPLGNDQLLILKQRACFVLRGQVDTAGDPQRTAAQLGIVSTTVGCIGVNAYDLTPQGVVFASHDGVYLWDGSSLQSITNNVIGELWRQGALDAAPAVVSPEFPVCTVGDRVFVNWPGTWLGHAFTHLIYDLRRGTWSVSQSVATRKTAATQLCTRIALDFLSGYWTAFKPLGASGIMPINMDGDLAFNSVVNDYGSTPINAVVRTQPIELGGGAGREESRVRNLLIHGKADSVDAAAGNEWLVCKVYAGSAYEDATAEATAASILVVAAGDEREWRVPAPGVGRARAVSVELVWDTLVWGGRIFDVGVTHAPTSRKS